MPTPSKIYFGHPSYHATPIDGLEQAASVLSALETLLASVDDLQPFQRLGSCDDPIHGLSCIIGGARHACEMAVAELSAATHGDDISATVRAAREKAIAATLKEGHSIEEISQALNLRSSAVERVIKRLQGRKAAPDAPPESRAEAV